ncbi:MAG TPA: TIGR02453 family protein, partial [Arthrobacter bacterium]|nr:TIGR02453 family protein [Arthrobacter sp.]
MSTFQGIPAGAFDFYAELEHNNNREWWLEHKSSYDTLIRDPVTALLAELEPRFGP